MKANAVLLGFTVPDSVAQEIFAMDPLPAVQTHKFAWALTRALRGACGNVRLLSSIPVQSYPIVPKLLFRGFEFRCGDEIRGTSIGFVNVIGLKHVTRLIGCLLRAPRMLFGWQTDVLFVHGIHTPYLLFALFMRVCGVKTVAVLTDPSGVVVPTDGGLAKRLKALDSRIVRLLLGRFSGTVALAPDLVANFSETKPTVVFPGILNADWRKAVEAAAPSSPRERFTVLYAGGLNRSYGVPLLVEAAAQLPDVDFVFLGKGDCVDVVAESGLDNVRYGGFVGPDELLAHAMAADVLINTRPPTAAFAVASFPSKLIEYLATGRPVLTTRIASIPPDLADAFFYIEDDGVEATVTAIGTLRAMDPETRAARGRQAREAVVSAYSEDAVAAKLARLVGVISGHPRPD